MSVKIIDQSQSRRLVIECPARCADRGCTDHVGQEWRGSTTLPTDTPIDYAYVLLERHAAEFPKSGPYRLVEYVTEYKETMEVL